MATKTYLIHWDAGWGESWDVVESENQESADQEAYWRWKEESENQAEYGAVHATRENLEEAGFDPDEYLTKYLIEDNSND